MAGETYSGSGRLTTTAARVFLRPGTGEININGRSLDVFFGRETARMIVRQPLKAAEVDGKFDIYVNVRGGGITRKLVGEIGKQTTVFYGNQD
jgi:small subunit ribosomal protein S9